MKDAAAAKKIFLIYSAIAAAAFVLIMFVYSRGISAPLDDAFIYFQYAKNTAAGHFMEYVRGEGYSSGATSLFYALLLTPFALIFKGGSIIIVTYAIGAASLFFTAYFIFLSVLKLTSKKEYAYLAAFVCAVNGNVLWGYFSGMEIGMFGAFLAAVFYYFMTRPGTVKSAIALSLLAVIRPEGFALSMLIIFSRIVNRIISGRKENLLLYIIPLAAGAVHFILNYIFTGDYMPNTMRAKSNFSLFYFYHTDIVAQGLALFNRFIDIIFNGGAEHYFPKYAFFVFLLGILPGAYAEIKNRNSGPFLNGIMLFFAGVLLTVFSSFATVHNYRYTMPFTVIYSIFFVYGIFVIIEAMKFKNAGQKKVFFTASASLMILFTVFTLGANAVNFGRDCRDIKAQSISAGLWIKNNIPEDAKIAINDAGAIAFYSEKRVFDLVGLVTNGQAKIFQNGKAGVFEEIEHVRPDYFMVHVGWFNYEPYTLFKKPRLKEFNIKREPPYFVVGSPEVCVATDFSLLGSGDTMKTKEAFKAGYVTKDSIDVCDMRSEKKHGYKIWTKFVSEYPGNLLEEGPTEQGTPGDTVLDAGRITSGGEEFTVTGLTPGTDLRIARRAHSPALNHLIVTVNGVKAVEWKTEEKKGFNEFYIDIPGDFIKGDKVKVRIEAATQNRYNAFYYWFLQKEKG